MSITMSEPFESPLKGQIKLRIINERINDKICLTLGRGDSASIYYFYDIQVI